MSRYSLTLLLCGLALIGAWQFAADTGGGNLQADERFQQRFDRAVQLLLQGDSSRARTELGKCSQLDPANPEVHYQLVRLSLLEFYRTSDPTIRSKALDAAAKSIEKTLTLSPAHIKALRLKFDLHRLPSLLHYDPDLAYEVAQNVITLEPFCYDFQLDVSRWLSGESRFKANLGDELPQSSELGLNRALDRLQLMLKFVVPHTAQEDKALLLTGQALAKVGKHREALAYFQSRLIRPLGQDERIETLRNLGTSSYRLGNVSDAANFFATAYELQPNLRDLWLLRVCLDTLSYSTEKIPSQLSFPRQEEEWDASKPFPATFSRSGLPPGLERTQGHGAAAWGDFDHDGREDLLIGGNDAFLTLLKNDGKSFREVTAQARLSGIPSGYSLNFVDYDNDGWLDIYVCLNGWSGPLPNRLLRNLGNGTFQDVSKEAGVDDPGSGFVSLWGDLDNDGDLDLVVANGVLKDGSTPQIYRNNGKKTFTNVTRQVGVVEPPEYGTIGIALGDYDRDGDLDLFINGWDPAPNRLYRNNGNFTFTEVALQAGVSQPPHPGSVCVFLDYNNDTYPDILTCSLSEWETAIEGLTKGYTVAGSRKLNPGTPRLFQNTKQGTFRDVTIEAGLVHPIGVASILASDLDNDGFVDLYFGASGNEWGRLEPSRFYRNNGNGTFSDLTRHSKLDQLQKTSGLTLFDLDSDGDLDVYVQSGGLFRGEWGRNLLYRNDTGNQNHWLQIQLTGLKSNRSGVGTQLIAKAGRLTVYRQFTGSESSGSGGLNRLSIGLGQNSIVDSLEVMWPSGERQVLGGIVPNRVMRVIEPGTKRTTQ